MRNIIIHDDFQSGLLVSSQSDTGESYVRWVIAGVSHSHSFSTASLQRFIINSFKLIKRDIPPAFLRLQEHFWICRPPQSSPEVAGMGKIGLWCPIKRVKDVW